MRVEATRLKLTNPTMSYNGLTIVLEKASRFDDACLLSGYAGDYVRSALNPLRVDDAVVEVASSHRRVLPRTKVILHLGDTRRLPSGVSLMQQRGAPWLEDGVINIATFFPQDAIDRKNYFDSEDEDEDDPGNVKSTGGATRRKNWRFWLRKDCQKAARLAQAEGLVTNKCSYVLNPMLDTALRALDRRDQTLYLDIETTMDLRLTCFGFAWDASEVYSIPVLDYTGLYYHDTLGTCRLLRALALAMARNEVVIHNASFDLFVLFFRHKLPIPARVFDTLLAHHRCFPEVEKSLGHCLSLYTDQPYHKNEGVFDPHNRYQQGLLLSYNAKDVESLALLKPQIEATAAKLEASESVAQANASLRPYLTASCQGLYYKEDKVKEVIVKNSAKVDQLNRCLGIMVGHELNANSWQQVGRYLYEEKGYEKLGSKEDSATDEKNLLQLALKHNNPVIKYILRIRALKKERGTFKFTPLPFSFYGAPPDPKLTCSWAISGTETFRLASRKLMSVWGSNMQNWTKRQRKVVVPPPGMKFLQVDQAGAEALIVAYLCKRGKYRALFENRVKPHIYVAIGLFQKQFEAELGFSLTDYVTLPIEQMVKLSKWPQVAECAAASDEWPGKRRFYFMAKKTCHSANYDIKWPTFRLSILQETEGQLVLTPDESKAFLSGYRTMFHEIPEWHLETAARVKSTRLLRNLFGYPRIFTGPLDEQDLKKAYAFVPQSTVGTITNLTFTEVFNALAIEPRYRDCSVVQNNHDSVLVQGPEELMPELTKLVQGSMNRKLVNGRGEEFQMKSSASVTDSWGG